ncbi:hypothetical protein QY96_02251 [Bacillus thermotolerans]|nr:hypothetical protein QY96_02251 [Bacillus thermotolerans]
MKWVLSKFAIHPNFNAKEVTVIFSGEPLEEDEKVRFINYFNEARFLKEYEIFPGNEDLFLHPKTDVVPFVIHAKKNNKDVTIFVYSYDDHIDVVKQHKGKVASYSLRSDELQEFTVAAKRLYAMQ